MDSYTFSNSICVWVGIRRNGLLHLPTIFVVVGVEAEKRNGFMYFLVVFLLEFEGIMVRRQYFFAKWNVTNEA